MRLDLEDEQPGIVQLFTGWETMLLGMILQYPFGSVSVFALILRIYKQVKD